MPWTVDPDPSFYLSDTTLAEYASYANDPDGPPAHLAEIVGAATEAANRGWFTPGPPEW